MTWHQVKALHQQHVSRMISRLFLSAHFDWCPLVSHFPRTFGYPSLGHIITSTFHHFFSDMVNCKCGTPPLLLLGEEWAHSRQILEEGLDHVKAWHIRGSKAPVLNLLKLSLRDIFLWGQWEAPNEREWEVCVVRQVKGEEEEEEEKEEDKKGEEEEIKKFFILYKGKLAIQNRSLGWKTEANDIIASPFRGWGSEILSTETWSNVSVSLHWMECNMCPRYTCQGESWKGLSVSWLLGLLDVIDLGFGSYCISSNLVLNDNVSPLRSSPCVFMFQVAQFFQRRLCTYDLPEVKLQMHSWIFI